ncbi:MAG: response regulator [bacterium]|nr:response regulator [bacterium]
MKTLIVEDDFTSRVLLQELLKEHGPAHLAVNGTAAVAAVRAALAADAPFDLVCLDIMMPEMDGMEALRQIRALEQAANIPPARRTRIVITTVLADMQHICDAYSNLCDAYLVKPIHHAKLTGILRKQNLIV